MKPIKIFMTSWFRYELTERVIRHIHERTQPATFEIHLYDNGSDPTTQSRLFQLQQSSHIRSLMLDARNTGCLYNKIVFQSMVEYDEKYYVVTDNDIIPPKLSPDWLARMVAVMDAHPSIALLTPQLPPVFLQEPYDGRSDFVLCKAVGNTFKMVRREALASISIPQVLGAFGDDGLVSAELQKRGWRVAFMRNMFCYNLERDYPYWGYTKEQVEQDPRKKGYGPPFNYKPLNLDTLTPPPEHVYK